MVDSFPSHAVVLSQFALSWRLWFVIAIVTVR